MECDHSSVQCRAVPISQITISSSKQLKSGRASKEIVRQEIWHCTARHGVVMLSR
jgi:hypothetical protein